MIDQIHKILKDYWGYDKFRYLQKEIIISVLTKNDTLALLPTGGGKSICFQVPALYNPGLCLVITPLIALMKDQVENLKKKGIKATAIYSGMVYSEIDKTLDSAIYGDYKFLYVSPERLETEIFLSRAEKMPLNLIAIDEAHCISQWGYDFRPSYLNIAEIRKFFPKVPFLALTATATDIVKNDIQKKLKFKSNLVFQKSFERENLIYAVLEEEAKQHKLLDLVNKIKGTGIIYVRTRKAAKDTSDFLRMHKISSDYYHAGLDNEERDKKQNSWKTGKTRIIVSTNAFGMGIDKPDVRFVIHLNLPDSLEAYYQEAGRGGRDLKKSYAIALVNEQDREEISKRFETAFPSIEDIKKCYHALGNYFQLPIGSGKYLEFDFDFSDFTKRFNLEYLTAYNSIKELEKAKYISISDNLFMPSRLMFKLSYRDLYVFQLDNPKYEALIKTILRSYEGSLENYVRINENELAKRLNTNYDSIIKSLNLMKSHNILDYIPSSDKPKIIFLTERLDQSNLLIQTQSFIDRKKTFEDKLKAVSKYVFETKGCRSKVILGYFGEKLENNCGHCDYCLKSKEDENLSNEEFKLISEKILDLLQNQKMLLNDLLLELKHFNKSKSLMTIHWLVDNNEVLKDNSNYLSLPEKKA